MNTSDLEIKFVPKGWGFEKWIVNNEEYCGKLLYFVKDKKCSWHYHEKKRETFYVQSGMIKLFYSMTDDFSKASYTILTPGDKFEIPRGMRHQMISIQDTELFEFSTTHFEEDSYRVIKGD
jgi:mannose-6-phosphate isomerase-like protein (cupin superfamily)